MAAGRLLSPAAGWRPGGGPRHRKARALAAAGRQVRAAGWLCHAAPSRAVPRFSRLVTAPGTAQCHKLEGYTGQVFAARNAAMYWYRLPCW